MNASEAAGPVYARAQQRQLVRDEDDFCLQIDAHTEFGRHWDMRMLAEWGAAANEYAILTAYPPNAMQLGKNVNGHWEMPHFCRARVVSPGIVRNEQASAAAGLTRPLMTALWGAGLSFSRCHAERRVPADPHLRHVFDGEEYSRGARLWTSGYDFYSPTRPIIGTYYGTDKGGKGGWRSVHAEWRASQARLSTLLLGRGSSQSPSARASLGEYALGTRRALSERCEAALLRTSRASRNCDRRTLEQYAAFSGVDVSAGQSRRRCLVDYVPWDDADLAAAAPGERARRRAARRAGKAAQRAMRPTA